MTIKQGQSPNLMLWAGVLLAGAAVPCRAGHLKEPFYRLIQERELPCLAARPAWAEPKGPMLFSFAWLADFHLTRAKLDRTQQALRYIDEHLKPSFVAITGDNNAYAPPVEREGKPASVGLRRHLFLKRFLDDHLSTPYVLVPGDNWPQEFEKVFGAFQYSFNYGGMHFVFTALDRCTYGVEGRSVFDDATWTWMREDLERHAQHPTLILMHETVLPPSFLDAGRLRALIAASPNVLALLSGHVHLDLDFENDDLRQIICPSLGENARHGFKLVRVYPTAVLLQSIELREGWSSYRPVHRWNRIEIPEALQGTLHKPKTRTLTKDGYREVPPHPRRHDRSLMRRTPELIRPMLDFMAQMPLHGKVRPRKIAQKPSAARMSEPFLDKTVTLADGSTRPYVVFVPRAYAPDRAWPAILFLHGAGERGTDNRGQLQVGVAAAIRNRLDRFGFITVLPQCAPDPAWWTDESEKAYAMAALNKTCREYQVDPKRTYLTGLSMGGYGTWALAADYPTTWAAIAPICGKGVPATAGAIAPIPCWCFHGAEDATVPVEHSREMIEALRAVGAKPRYTEYPGVGHNSWDRAYDTEELYAWLLSHRLGEPASAD